MVVVAPLLKIQLKIRLKILTEESHYEAAGRIR